MDCAKCNHITNLEIEINFKYFICPKCFSLYEFKNNQFEFKKELTKIKYNSYIEIGKSVIFENETYCVANLVVKKINPYEVWTEFELIAISGKKKYVVLEKGHWTISEKIELNKNFNTLEIYHDNIDYKLFEKDSAINHLGVGFFDYIFKSEQIGFRDFINPPYILSVDLEDGNPNYYLGKSISNKEIKKVFNLEKLPAKEGIGIVQPFYLNLDRVLMIFSFASIVILILHLFFYQTAKNQLVFKQTIDLSTQLDKEIETNVFELKGPIAPLNIIIDTDVDNSWLATDFTLINQTTGEIAYFTKDVERYSGYEDGESWTEGSQTEDFTICGVSSGKYKIAFKSTKDTNDVQNTRLFLEVFWDKSNSWNFLSVLICFGVTIIILYIIKNNFETRRWYDSDYSPYKKDE
jgi:hypothetical protein